MGRVRLEIKRIENSKNRQTTYCKRRYGLIKKAYELSVLCDTDTAVIMFSPSGTLSVFCNNDRRIEDVITRFAHTPGHLRPGGQLENVEVLNSAVRKLNSDREREVEDREREVEENVEVLNSAVRKLNREREKEVEELRSSLKTAVMDRQISEENARLLIDEEKCLENLSCMNQLVDIENALELGLLKLRKHKQQLAPDEFTSREHASSVQQMMGMSNQGETSNSSDGRSPATNIGGAEGQRPQFHTWMDHKVNQGYIYPTPASMAMMGASPGRETERNSGFITSLNLSYVQSTAAFNYAVGGQGSKPVPGMHARFSERYMDPAPMPKTKTGAFTMKETGQNAELPTSLYQGALQSQQLPLAALGQQLKRRRGDEAGEPNNNFYHRVTTESDSPYYIVDPKATYGHLRS